MNDDKAIRVRFAPSPTGSLHVGVARTAIFNWLFARRHGGVFILRMEDTDQDRSIAESETAIMDSLRWLGLDWDEGPDAPGDKGPYRQSERRAIYADAAASLAAQGKAYPCFCREEELQAKRERARAEGRPPRYDGTCADLATADAAARARSEAHTLRFRAPSREIRVKDAVRGEVLFQPDTVGDFIIMRGSGLPVYNFACVVDDAAMAVSHVLRGEDHLSNTLRQVMLYEAMDLPLPVFAHLPMILGEDRSKLSKRHGAVSIEEFKAKDYPADAVLNYLSLLGWNPGDGRELMSRDEIVAAFELERVGKAAAIFDHVKMDWLAGMKIREAGPEALLADARRFLPEEDDERLLLLIRTVIDHLHCAADLPGELELLRGDLPEPDDETRPWLDRPELFAALAAALAADAEPLSADAFKQTLKQVGKDLGVKGKELFMPVRAALTGQLHGPELPLVAQILGRDEVIRRLG